MVRTFLSTRALTSIWPDCERSIFSLGEPPISTASPLASVLLNTGLRKPWA